MRTLPLSAALPARGVILLKTGAMILRAGFQSFEFQEGRELRFGSTQEAANWLKHLGYPDSDFVAKLRELMTRYAEDPADSRMTDYQVLQRVAALLYSRRIVVIGREQRSSGQAAAATAAPPPAFPLSERAPRASTASSPPPASDPPTFGPNAAAAAQASALVAAAAAGTPFCQECSKS